MRPLLTLLLPLFLFACKGGEDDTGNAPVDADNDGATADVDCNDEDDTIHPDAAESCDGVDNDCDGLVDEDDSINAHTFYADFDTDGYGNPDLTVEACDLPPGFVSDATDCDDANPAIHPGAQEDDCTDPIDYNCDTTVVYADADGDGWAACVDCDDTEAATHPGAPETCNSVDDNCNGVVDDDATDATTWYADADGDGHGSAQLSVNACTAPSGWLAGSDDCNDLDAATYTGATEICDGLDNDCDLSIPADELDTDSDGWTVCAGDCNDSDEFVFPAAPETCDGVDEDCNGYLDDGPVDAAMWHLDADADGYGAPSVTVLACTQPNGWVSDDTDCDDFDANTWPGASEACDGAANNCGQPLPVDEEDSDGDGWMVCEGDCDPGDATAFPTASEFCDGIDNDCDGVVDDSPADQTAWYRDADGDGYGDPFHQRLACVQPLGFVAAGTDCDDGRADAWPGAIEIPGNGVDDDCVGGDVPLLIYTVANQAGVVWAIERDTGNIAWTHTGLPVLADVAVGSDGRLYATAVDTGVIEISADGATSSTLVSGYTGVHGIFFDHARHVLLVTTSAGEILEIDPDSGAVSTLSSTAPSGPLDVARLVGDPAIWVASQLDSTLYHYDPALDTYTGRAFLPAQIDEMVLASDGGVFISSGEAGHVYHVNVWTGTYTLAADPGVLPYGLCADPHGDDGLVFTDRNATLHLLDTTTSTSVPLNSALDEPWGCATNVTPDMDGDGHVARTLGGEDCDDLDPAISPDATDDWGNGVDENCDWMDGLDLDRDHNLSVASGGTDCDDDDDTVFYGRPGCEALDCLDLQSGFPQAPSGVYTDASGFYPFEAYCEMGRAGGGWTMVAYNWDIRRSFLSGTFHEVAGPVLPTPGSEHAINPNVMGMVYTEIGFYIDDPQWTDASRTYHGFWIGNDPASIYDIRSNTCQLLHPTEPGQWSGQLVYFAGDGANDNGCSGGGSVHAAHACDDGGGGITTNNAWPLDGSDTLWGYNCISSYDFTGSYQFGPLDNLGLHAYYVR